jgi:hypothetical protein
MSISALQLKLGPTKCGAQELPISPGAYRLGRGIVTLAGLEDCLIRALMLAMLENEIIQHQSQPSRVTTVLDPDLLRWLRSATYRQQSSIHTIKLCRHVGGPIEPVSALVTRFR